MFAIVKTAIAMMSVMKGSFDVLVLFITDTKSYREKEIQKHNSSHFPVYSLIMSLIQYYFIL